MAKFRPDAHQRQRNTRRLPMVILTAVVLFVAVAVLGQHAMGSNPNSLSAEQASRAPTENSHDSSVVRRIPGDPRAIGDVNAPVVLTQWTDLRCPFCASFHRETLPSIIEDYVRTGKVRIEYIDVAYFGDQSSAASAAARAAAQQGKYEQYLDAVYSGAPENGHPDFSRSDLLAFATTAGVSDTDAFTTALESAAVAGEVRTDTTSAQELGVSAVPFFVAGNTALSGAQPIEVFRKFLDQAVSEAAGA